MKKIKLFCFGFGQVAQSFVKKISSEKISIELTTTLGKKQAKKILKIFLLKVLIFLKITLIRI